MINNNELHGNADAYSMLQIALNLALDAKLQRQLVSIEGPPVFEDHRWLPMAVRDSAI